MAATVGGNTSFIATQAPPVPLLDAIRGRVDLENAMRLWALGVRFAMRDLVTLGRPYELHFAPHSTPVMAPLEDLAPFGFELVALYGSHIMRVKDTAITRVAARVVSLQGAPTAADASPLDSVRVDDFLIGINGDDLLLAPSTGVAQVRKRILRAYNSAIAHGAGVVTLRFVRLDATVQVDPTRQVTHGSVLRMLASLGKTFDDLKARHGQLLNQNRAVVSQRLTRHKKLLGFGMHMVQTLQAAVHQDERFRFAAKFQQWYAAMMAESEYQYEEDEDVNSDPERIEVLDLDSDTEMERPMMFEIDDDCEVEEEEKRGPGGDSDVTEVLPVTVNPSLPPAQPRPADIDLRWRSILRAQEMKWLPNANAVLTKYIKGLVDGFASDGFWSNDMVTQSRSIAEQLVKLYASKLRTSSMDNASVRREFLKHARMVRSNLANAGNKQLRHDVLSGVLSIAGLCGMTSEQLAPKALQEDRQRRSELHAKEITITAPTGPVLLKTKHGFKEVNAIGTLLPVPPDGETPDDSNAIPPQEQTDDIGGSTGPQPTGLAPPGSAPSRVATPAEEVTQRLSVLGVNASAVDDNKAKDVAKIPSPPTRQSPPTPSADPPADSHATSKPIIAAPTLESRRFTADDFRKFLMVMFDPAQDLEGTIGQLQSVVHSTPLSTMSNEFQLAPGVQLYRDILTAQTQRGTVHFRARVRVLNWTFQQDSSSDREATMNALHQLMKEILECRRLFGRLLDQLQSECGFPQAVSNHRAHHLAMDVLVREGMKVNHESFHRRGDDDKSEDHRGDAQIDRIVVATVYADSVIAARDRAVRSAAAFMNELVAVRNSIAHPPRDPSPPPRSPEPAPRTFGSHNYERERFEQERYRQDGRYADNGMHYEDDRSMPMDNHGYGLLDRKRPFDHTESSHHSNNTQPPPVRRKIEAPPSSREKPIDQPLFFNDSKGEERRAVVDPEEKERQLKLQVETYQELLRALFRNRADVKAQARFDWDPNVPEKVIEFTNRLKVSRTVSRIAASGNYVCSLKGMDGNLCISNSNASLDAAVTYVMKMLHQWLDRLHGDWSQLVDTYIRIMERKFLQRGKQPDASLSAGNETRKDRSVNAFTAEQEKARGSSSEYTITVRSDVVVRRVCLNMKMAKRAAGEDFRDLLEWIKKTRLETTRNSAVARAPTNAAPARPPPKKPSNMIECSDDSDDDDDDDYHGGGAYSDDEDWHPLAKATDATSAATTPDKANGGGGTVRSRIDAILKDPYPMESERGTNDDARFRAVLRSLFTPEDELCTGISEIRGALKYRGHFERTIVPNVKASIRLELLRGETFNVFASVNDVIHFKATASSKTDACDKAVNGLLQELDRLRQVWTEMIHFYHTKELANNDPMDSFNKLRLANITKIETRTETAPATHPHNRHVEAKMATDVHCVIYFGKNVVYRVNDTVESDAHTMATCRALRFVLDLIDKGLDPTPVDEPDHRFSPMPDANMRCTVDLEDFGDRKKRREYFADARWAIRERVPGPDFGLPERLTLKQHDRVPMQTFERSFGSSRDPNLYYFRLEATYENGKFVNHVAEYGHKNKYRTYVLKLEVVENRDLDVFVFPPGASVNSTGNLYWSRKVMPSEIGDVKAVYGYVVRRRPPQ